MAVTAKHGLHCLTVGTGVVVGGLTQQSISTGTEIITDAVGGSPYSRIMALSSQKPAASFSSVAIGAVIDAVPLTGKNIGDLTGGFIMYAQQYALGGIRTSGSAHRKYTMTKGLLIPRTLSVSHQQDATISVDAMPIADGANAPMIEADTVALPTDAGDAQRYTLGPITIGAISLTHARSVQIDFGINATTEGADSTVWDDYASIDTIMPTITITGVSIEWLKSTAIPMAGKAATQANTTIYLRKRASGAQYVADGTAEHILFNAAGMAYVTDAFSAGGTGGATCTVVLRCMFDGTNAPIVVDTTSAIA